jgi:hypothetical protein
LVVLLSLVHFRWSRKGICCYVVFARDVLYEVVVFLEVSMPVCCSTVEVFGGFPILEVCIIGKDGEGVFSPS